MDDPTDNIEADTVKVNRLQAGRLGIVDSNNRLRITLNLAPNTGTPVIGLHDTSSKYRAYVKCDENERGLIALPGDNQSHRVLIGLDDDDQPEIQLCDKAGELRAQLYVRDKSQGLVMYDRNGKRRLSLFLDEEGKPRIKFRNAEGQSQVTVTVADDGSECIILQDQAGEELRIPLKTPREL